MLKLFPENSRKFDYINISLTDDIITTKLLELGSCNFETVLINPCVLHVT